MPLQEGYRLSPVLIPHTCRVLALRGLLVASVHCFVVKEDLTAPLFAKREKRPVRRTTRIQKALMAQLMRVAHWLCDLCLRSIT